MRVWILHSLSRIVPLGLACAGFNSQAAITSLPASAKPEPGLEKAVGWKWTPAPPPTDEWGVKLPEKPKPGSPLAEATAPAEPRPTTYEVVKGDAIVKIARKFHITSEQLMQFNELKSDLIQIGQILRIPTPEELLAMAPPPVAIPVDETSKEPEKPAGRPGLELPPTNVEELELQTVLVQVFLDRELFSQGPIDGDYGPMFEQMRQKYLDARPYVSGKEELKTRALAAVDHPYTTYTLRAEDFRFIDPRKEEPVETAPPTPDRKQRKKKAEKPEAPPPPPPVTYDELASARFLAYHSAWEFVAERFHCDEKFLRRINPHIDRSPIVGTVFQVPNVIPFEIEKPLGLPLQPSVDPLKPVTAAVVDFSFLEISRGGILIAVMPLASARPGLRGRGTWTVLHAIPRPQLITHREPREAPVTHAVANMPLPPKETLAPGPNNPVGIVWIDLAKSANDEPLPYGLHGTSIPGEMRFLQGIGGLRLANWDIVRAARLLPVGTPLQWKTR